MESLKKAPALGGKDLLGPEEHPRSPEADGPRSGAPSRSAELPGPAKEASQ